MRILRFVLVCSASLGLAGCVAEGAASPSPAAASGAAAAQPVKEVVEAQPRTATYRCDHGETLSVENLRSSVVLTDGTGDSVTLPAAPAAQQSRYGQEGYALVLDGDEALYMKGGKEPLTCRR